MEAFRKGERVAAHARFYVRGGYTTLKEHMPPEHRGYAEWSPERFIHWAGKTGAATARLVEKILSSRPYAEQGYRSCLGIIHLGRDFEPERVEGERRDLLEVVEDRYQAGATIITSQCPISDWHPNIGDPTLADAICDRLLHNAYKIELRGDSMRIKSPAGNRKNERKEAIVNDGRLS